MKPTFNIDEHTADEWRAILAEGEENIPSSWWEKNEYEKRQWLKKKVKQQQRWVHVDLEKEKAEEQRIRMATKLIRKRRQEQLEKYGI